MKIKYKIQPKKQYLRKLRGLTIEQIRSKVVNYGLYCDLSINVLKGLNYITVWNRKPLKAILLKSSWYSKRTNFTDKKLKYLLKRNFPYKNRNQVICESFMNEINKLVQGYGAVNETNANK